MLETKVSIIKRLQIRIKDITRATDMIDLVRPAVFPPTTLTMMQATEDKLGFGLPELLRDIYTQVGNGGFGPGYGLIGLDDGARDDLGRSISDLYLFYRRPNPEDPYWHWPDQLVPVCHWGCAIYSCLDCSQPTAPVIVFDPNPHEEGRSWDNSFIPHTTSFHNWIDSWLNGVDLWKQVFPAGME